jgi:hypothetical protein
MSPPVMNIAPLDIDYEGPGGWGYSVAAADEISDGRTSRKWAPALGWAQLVPESVTDLLAEQCPGLISSGKLFLAPAELIGLSKNMERGPSRRYENFASTATAFNIEQNLRIVEQLELPYLDGINVRDMVRFSEDYHLELTRFRELIKDLVVDQKDLSRCVREVNDAVREIQDSDCTETVIA